MVGALAAALLHPPGVAASGLSLAWDPVDYDVAHYKVYCGRAPGQYELGLLVPDVRLSLSAIGPGTYYFAVSAVTSNGRESSISQELVLEITQRDGELKTAWGESRAGWKDTATAVRLNDSSYRTGDTPKITELAITNLAAARTVDWRLWAKLPNGTKLPLLRIEELRLESQQTLDFTSAGAVPLMPLSSGVPAGSWSLAAEMIDRSTGRVIRADIVSFLFVPPAAAQPSWSIQEIDRSILLFDALRVEAHAARLAK